MNIKYNIQWFLTNFFYCLIHKFLKRENEHMESRPTKCSEEY